MSLPQQGSGQQGFVPQGPPQGFVPQGPPQGFGPQGPSQQRLVKRGPVGPILLIFSSMLAMIAIFLPWNRGFGASIGPGGITMSPNANTLERHSADDGQH